MIKNILISILVVVILGGGAYLYIKNRNQNYNIDLSGWNLPANQQDTSSQNTATQGSTTTQVTYSPTPSVNQSAFTVHKNTTAGYQISYPSSWNIYKQSESLRESVFEIENIKGVVLSGDAWGVNSNGSWMQILVEYEMNYASIDDFIKDPKIGLSRSTQERINSGLASLENMNIGGKNLRVLHTKESTNEGYVFIFDNKLYRVTFVAGSVPQYALDSKIFAGVFSSFTFLSSSLSTTLPTPYISAQNNWPPVIQNSTIAYSCNVGQTSEMEKIVQKVINGRTYCIDTQTEGAAGSSYSTYSYTTTNGNGTKTTNFILRSTNCGVYTGSQMIECQNAQSNFNLDAIVDGLM